MHSNRCSLPTQLLGQLSATFAPMGRCQVSELKKRRKKHHKGQSRTTSKMMHESNSRGVSPAPVQSSKAAGSNNTSGKWKNLKHFGKKLVCISFSS
jgi:hypothetical protein